MHVALVGPCSPQDVVSLLDGGDAERAARAPGYRGVPVSELAKGLVEAGHQVTVCSLDSSLERSTERYLGDGFQLLVQRARPRSRDYFRDFYAAERRGMASLLRDAAPDVVHAHWTYEFELAAQDSGLPHVTTARDAPWTILRQVPDAYRAARLAVAWRARPGIRDLVVASPYMVQAWRRQMLYKREMTVIPNMIMRLPAGGSRKSRVPSAICVADPSPRKNIEALARSFVAVRREFASARLRVVGPELAESDALPSRLAAAGLADGIEFLGRLGREQLAAEMASAWCLVHPSLEESFGNTLVEALSLGTPVIGGRDSGAVPWVLDYGRAGDLVDVRSDVQLANALVRRFKAGPTPPPMRADELLDTRYSRETIIQLHVDAYERVSA